MTDPTTPADGGERLLACPFCGWEATPKPVHIECSHCGARGPTRDLEKNGLGWNDRLATRPPRQADEVREAAASLASKLHAVHADPAYAGVWAFRQAHAGPYRGPTYTDELAALDAALAAPAPAPVDAGGVEAEWLVKPVAEAIDACGNDGRAGWDWWQNEARAAISVILAALEPSTALIEALEAVRLTEEMEDAHSNCSECEGHDQPELCERCFPAADEARLRRRRALALAGLLPPGFADGIAPLAVAQPPATPADEGEVERVALIIEQALVRHGVPLGSAEGTLDDAEEVLAALRRSGVAEVPAGMKLVPVEPTDAMLTGARKAWWHTVATPNAEAAMQSAWAAMLSAAPNAPGGGEQRG